MKKKNEEISIKEIFDILLPKVWIIALVSLLCASIAFVYFTFVQKDRYTSSSLVYIYSDTQQNATTGDLDVAITMVDVYKVMLTTDAFLTPVLMELPEKYASLELQPSQIKQMIDVQQVDATQIIKVSVTSTNRELAYDIACKIVELAPGQLDTIVPNALSVVSIDHPVKAQTPDPKNEVRNTVLVFVVAFLISIFAVWVRSYFDVKVKNAQGLESKLGVPVLKIMPKYESSTGAPEEYKSLYSKILYLPIIGKCKRIAITSANSGEGKNRVSSNIAITMAENTQSKRILLVDLDMRSPAIAELMSNYCKIPDEPSGLSEFLAGIDESPAIRKSSFPNLDILLSGKDSANSGGLIKSPRFQELISACEANYDYIIFNCPPVNEVPDALLISDKVDGYIMSARDNCSKINALSDAVSALKEARGEVFCLVLSNQL